MHWLLLHRSLMLAWSLLWLLSRALLHWLMLLHVFLHKGWLARSMVRIYWFSSVTYRVVPAW